MTQQLDMPTFTEIEYNRPSLESFQECTQRVKLKIMTAHTPERVELALLDFQKEYCHFETARAICMIRHDQNISDPFYQEETVFFEKASATVLELSAGVYNALLNTETKDACKKRFGEMIFKKAKNRKETVNREIVPSLAREAALENEYDRILSEGLISYGDTSYNIATITPLLESSDRTQRKEAHEALAGFYSGQKENFDRIFDEMSRLRTDMAVKLGYPSFVELGYKRMERYDYTPEMVASFREMVVKYVVPLTVEIRRLQKERLGCDSIKYYDLKNLFATGNPKPKVDCNELADTASRLFCDIFDKSPSFYNVLETHGFTDILAREGKGTGGYCATLVDYGIPFVFLNANPIATDVTTLLHEAGHAYAAIRSVDASAFVECLSPTLETCEIHSTAMEFLAYPFMEHFFGDEAGAYRELHMAQSLLFLPYGCMVDEFQHEIYSHPEMPASVRHDIWHDLESKYQPFLDYDGNEFYSAGGAWQKKGHIFTDPFYYIDYCLSLVVALEIWDISQKNYRNAFSRYDQLCMKGGAAAFQDLLQQSLLSSPFWESTMKRISYQACRFLRL